MPLDSSTKKKNFKGKEMGNNFTSVGECKQLVLLEHEVEGAKLKDKRFKSLARLRLVTLYVLYKMTPESGSGSGERQEGFRKEKAMIKQTLNT